MRVYEPSCPASPRTSSSCFTLGFSRLSITLFLSSFINISSNLLPFIYVARHLTCMLILISLRIRTKSEKLPHSLGRCANPLRHRILAGVKDGSLRRGRKVKVILPRPSPSDPLPAASGTGATAVNNGAPSGLLNGRGKDRQARVASPAATTDTHPQDAALTYSLPGHLHLPFPSLCSTGLLPPFSGHSPRLSLFFHPPSTFPSLPHRSSPPLSFTLSSLPLSSLLPNPFLPQVCPHPLLLTPPHSPTPFLS